MALLTLILEYYFAITLGVAGLTKLDDTLSFERTLQQQKIFPLWSTKALSKTVPWIEITLALLLVTGVGGLIVAIVLVALFLMFLGIKMVLLLKKSDADCGCTMQKSPQKVDGISVTVSTLLALLATLHLWLVFRRPSVHWIWRLSGAILFVGTGSFLVRKILMRRQLQTSFLATQTAEIGEGKQAPLFVAIDQFGNTVRLEDYFGQPLLLAFVAPGCPACPHTLVALKQIIQEEQGLTALVVGSSNHEENRLYAIEHGVDIPFLTLTSDIIEERYKVDRVPLVFLLDETGVIRVKRVANSIEHMRLLLQAADSSLTIP